MGQRPPREFGPALRTATRAAGISGRELARRIGVDHSHVARMLRGESCPSSTVAERLVHTLALTHDVATVIRRAAVTGVGRDRRLP